MANGAASDEILSKVSMQRLAERLGTDEDTARDAAEAALPALLAGMTRQAGDPAQRVDLAAAVRSDHDPGMLDDDDPLAGVDPDDGQKIVSHVFGEDAGRVESELQGFLGGSGGGGLMAKVLPMLAPLVMSYLARKMTGSTDQPTSRSTSGRSDSPSGGGGLGDILGSVLGGNRQEPPRPEPEPDSGGGLGSVFGGLFDGLGEDEDTGGGGLGDLIGKLGGKAGSGGGLDDLLGSILGGRR